MKLSKRLELEHKTLRSMIATYCYHKHCGGKGLCESCAELEEYSRLRLSRCPFGDEKPACQNCQVHCYNKLMCERIREVMRFSGPRLMWKHPVLALQHLYKSKFTPALELKEFNKRQGTF